MAAVPLTFCDGSVLGWTLLTLAGLCLTASGIVFQLRRGQVRSFVAGVRATLATWD